MKQCAYNWRLALLVSGHAAIIFSGCSAIDDREPTLSSGMTAGPQQAAPSLRPTPAASGAAGSSGSVMQSPQPAGPAPQPGDSDPETATATECPVDTPCTTSSARPGACSQQGQCIEYCAAGVSRVGACLVQPG